MSEMGELSKVINDACNSYHEVAGYTVASIVSHLETVTAQWQETLRALKALSVMLPEAEKYTQLVTQLALTQAATISRLEGELKEKEKQLDQTILCWRDDKRTAKLNWDNAREALECAIAANELVLSQLQGGSDLTVDQVAQSLNSSLDKARAALTDADDPATQPPRRDPRGTGCP